MKIVFTSLDHNIIVEQSQAKDKLLRVTYGQQVKGGLTYCEAAHELGECLFHALACESKLDNNGK